MRQLARRRGLTLVEMLVTVVMLGIAAAIVIPEMGGTAVLRVQAGARTIAADMMFAQTEAMAFQTRRALYFNALPSAGGTYQTGNGYVLAEPTGSTLNLGNLNAYALPMPGSVTEDFVRDFRDDTVSGGGVLEDALFDGDGVLLFDELGGPLQSLASTDPGDGGSVVLEAAGFGVAYEVSVEPMTGRIDVTEVAVD